MTAARTIAADPDLRSRAFEANPFPYYAWLITRYDDVLAALREIRNSSRIVSKR